MLVELKPKDSHKSFYGKALVELKEDGSRVLYSYNTPIIIMHNDGSLKRLWDGWSATTGRHVAAFCGINKKQYMELEV